MSENQPGGEAEVCVIQRERNSQKPKNEREHGGLEAVTEYRTGENSEHSEYRTGERVGER